MNSALTNIQNVLELELVLVGSIHDHINKFVQSLGCDILYEVLVCRFRNLREEEGWVNIFDNRDGALTNQIVQINLLSLAELDRKHALLHEL
jgi:hypothetical protein